MKIQVLPVFIFMPVFCFAQGRLTGFVKEQNAGTKISGVKIRSNSASNSITSDDSGYFILKFQDVGPGENIIVYAQKDGWELVNEKEMNTLIPKNADEEHFKIILCKAGMLAKARSIYYETFELNLQNQLAKQKALNKGNERKILSLQDDYTRIQKKLYDLADEYSRIDLSDASAKDLEAIELFKKGKYEEFITLKNSIVTEAQVAKAIKGKSAATKVIFNSDSTINLYIKSQKDIANTLVIQFKFAEAEKILENINSIDSTNLTNTFDFAYFLQQQKEYDKAIQYYKRALQLTKNDIETANIQNNLGILYADKNDFSSARIAYNNAFHIYAHLIKDSAAAYLFDEASTLNNMGVFFKNDNDYPMAFEIFNLALKTYELFPNEDGYEEGEAKVQNNLGILFHEQNNFPASLIAYNKALEIYERLAKKDPASYEPKVAMTLGNLAPLYEGKNQYNVAFNAYNKALEIYERFTKNNPRTYGPDVARILGNLGLLYRIRNDYPAALDALSKALKIYENFAKEDTAAYEPKVAWIQNSLGILYQDKNDTLAALTAFKKAYDIRLALALKNPGIYGSDVATTLNDLGKFYTEIKWFESAFEMFTSALVGYKDLAKYNHNPLVSDEGVAQVENSLGVLYQRKIDYPPALIAYTKALNIYERLAKNNQAAYLPDVATTQNNLGILNSLKKDYPAALKAYGTALKIRERLAKGDPTYQPAVAATLEDLGNLYEDQKNYKAALKVYRQCLEIYEQLAKNNPTTYEPNLAEIQEDLGNLYVDKKDNASALKSYSIALEIYDRLSKANAAAFEPNVAEIQDNIGDIYDDEKDYPAAFKAYNAEFEIYNRLAKDNPKEYEIELCSCILSLAWLQVENYQENKQMMIEDYLIRAKPILLKYPELTYPKELLQQINDLNHYFGYSRVIIMIDSLQTEKEKTENSGKKVKLQEEIVDRYRSLVSSGHNDLVNDLGTSLSSLAWSYLFEKQFSAAENAAKEALNPTRFRKTDNYDAEIEWANTNLALALLFQGKFSEAEKIYIALKDRPYHKTTYKETFLADLDELEKAGISHPDIVKIRTLLKK